MKKVLYLIFSLTLVAIVVGLVLIYAGRERNKIIEDIEYAPDFWLKTLDNQRFYLNAQREKIVVMVFWSTDCSVCKTEMIDLQTSTESEGLSLVAVCTDPYDNFDLVKNIVENLDIKYPVLLDAQGKIAEKYNVTDLPTTIIIGPEGKIQYTFMGYDVNTRLRIDNAIINLRKTLK